ncbi:MAG TPA: right-handed parallel beta-helix repeat-containing protein, partial [bacterium]|nr:right-handed parallel beta-helix repeat-containing protein [bacterium]
METIVSGLSSPTGLAVDVAGGKVYYSDNTNIRRANLDGTSQQNLYSETFVWGLVLDARTQKIYWGNQGSDQIKNAPMSGGSPTVISTNSGFDQNVLAIDTIANKLYYATGLSTKQIRRINLDGSGDELLLTLPNEGRGIALDLRNHPPAALSGFFAMGQNNSIVLKWRKGVEDDIIKYRIFAGPAPNPTTQIDSTTGGIGDTSKTITVANGLFQYYRVAAVNAGSAQGAYSNQDVAIPAAGSGNALVFNGSSYVEIANEAAFDFTNSVTLEAWIRVNSFDQVWQAIVTKGDNTYRLTRNNATNALYFAASGPGSVSGSKDVADGLWHHVAGVYDIGNSELRLYVDGELDGVSGASGPIDLSDAPIWIGNNYSFPGRAWNGEIDEVRVWNTARTQSQIFANMHVSLRGDESGLAGLWHFDESSGTTTYDATAGGNNGTLINGPTFTASGAMPLVVTSILDNGAGTLRSAINFANANPGADTIRFATNIDGATISLASALPMLTDDSTFINADINNDSLPNIFLDGQGTTPNGFNVASTAIRATIQGFHIDGFTSNGITSDAPFTAIQYNHFGLISANAQGITLTAEDNKVFRNVIAGGGTGIYGGSDATVDTTMILDNLIGTNASGTVALRPGNGIYVTYRITQKGWTIKNNVINGNTNAIQLNSAFSFPLNGFTIIGNKIGTDKDGVNALGGNTGILIGQNSRLHHIGDGTVPGGNLISGNSSFGIQISNTDSIWILGNYIGTDVTGNASLGNNAGVSVSTSNNIWIGDGTIGGRNVISDNTTFGVGVSGGDSVRITGNYIGLGVNGNTALGNQSYGVSLANDEYTIVRDNVVASNNSEGMYITGGMYRIVDNNIIGLNAAGNLVRPNSAGIFMSSSKYNKIGESLGNTISGNTNDGLIFSSADSNEIYKNVIGLGTAGVATFANGGTGIILQQSSANYIGNGAASGRNIISSNAGHGIRIIATAAKAENNLIRNNYIGVGADGSLIRGNGQNGISLYSIPSFNTTGNYFNANVIAHNGFYGVEADGASDADSNQLDQNILFANTLGGVNYVSGSQGGVASPRIEAMFDDSTVAIQAAPGAYIQVFADAGSQGEIPLITGFADASGGYLGDVRLALRNYFGYNITATQDSAGNTSGFAVNTWPFGLTDPTLVANNNNSGTGSLRFAINYANSHAGPDTIRFDVPMVGQTIFPATMLPDITDDSTVIDGDIDMNGLPDITLNGAPFNVPIGLTINSNYNEIRNLNITGFGSMASGIDINGGAYNLIVGCRIYNNNDGVNVFNGAHHNRIGDGTIAGRNYIYNNTDAFTGFGILIEGFGTDSNIVYGNFIGTADGLTESGNSSDGVMVRNQARYNRIGGVGGSYNVISGNGRNGIRIESDSNTVTGNFIGLDSIGTGALGNQGYGIHLLRAHANTIGGTAVGSGNVIVDNSQANLNGAGVYLDSATYNEILGNYLGVDVYGNSSIANQSGGGGGSSITLDNQSNHNIIGDGTAGGRNVMGAGGSGADMASHVLITNNSNFNLIAGNYIGVGSDGATALGIGSGVYISGSIKNQIGLPAPAEANIISGNPDGGIVLSDADSTLVLQNYIGVNASGNAAVGNSFGVRLNNGTTHANIGNATVSGRNIISGNSNFGISIEDVGTDSNLVRSNLIGLDLAGTTAVPNSNAGISIQDGVDNEIGDGSVGGRNVISGNSGHGIYNFSRTRIAGNFVGLDISGNDAIGNTGYGIYTVSDSTQISGNVISGNSFTGIQVVYGRKAQIQGNAIGLDATGTIQRANGTAGVVLFNHSDALVESNTITGNTGDGIRIEELSFGNTIFSNNIGMKDGPIGNSQNGIVLIDNGSSYPSNNIIDSNYIAYNGNFGITIQGTQTDSNAAARNYIYKNIGGSIDISGGAQQGINPPTITLGTYGGTVAGTANSNALVYVYADSADQGEYFLDTVRADGSGNWTVSVTPVSGTRYTAIQEYNAQTSEFSAPFIDPLLVINTNDAGAGSLRD